MNPVELPLTPHIFGHARTIMAHAWAREGLGWENIVVKFRKRDPDCWNEDWCKIVRDIVIHGGKR
jgi:hypothetical protein